MCRYQPSLFVHTVPCNPSGGFLAGGWGDGTVTQALHRESFKLHEQLASELGLETYRKIPTLSVAGGSAWQILPATLSNALLILVY